MNSSIVSGSDWAGLPKHLLDMVLLKLNIFSDYARFSAVCVPWYNVAMENHKQFAKKIDRQLPMLLFPEKDKEKGKVKNLYNVGTNQITKVEIRVPFSTRYGGSSKGWLITMGEDFGVTLINPMSPGAVITLPPIPTRRVDFHINIRKAILSVDPIMEPNDCTVAIIHGDQCQLAFIKPGRHDGSWTFIDRIRAAFEDIIYHEGRLHAVDYAFDAFSFDENILMASSVPRKLPPIPKHLYTSGDGRRYLVESLAGELLLVRRLISFFLNGDDDFSDIDSPFRNTLLFEVFKWNPSESIWVKMESLGSESLFLGDNMSTSILASEFPGCSPNSIYFTHDLTDGFGDEPRDSGVFNLDNSSIAPHYVRDQATLMAMSQQPPIWFVPSLQFGTIQDRCYESSK